MKLKNKLVNKNAKELAEALGLSHVDAIEWEVRFLITKRIIDTYKKHDSTITEIAKNSGTSRGRITKILKEETQGISLDVLVRVLGSMGEEMKVSFKKSAA
jgi:hypothetical protein